MFSGDAYWLELLLQSKNASMFTAKERSRFGHLLSETDHFKETLISVESRRKVGQLYKYVTLKKQASGGLVCDAKQADLSLFVVLYGCIASFGNANHNFTFSPMEEEISDTNHIEGVKLQEFLPGSAFGIYTACSHAKFTAVQDSSILVIPAEKYEKLFPAEIARFRFINKHLPRGLLNPSGAGQRSRRRGSTSSSQESFNDATGGKACEDMMSAGEWHDPKQISGAQLTAAASSADTATKSSSGTVDLIANFTVEAPPQQEICLAIALKNSKISFAFELTNVAEKKYLFNEGDSVDYFYLLRSGSLSYRKSGQLTTLRKYLPGEFLGYEEESVAGKRSFSCFAEDSDTSVYRVTRQAFEGIITSKEQLNLTAFFLDCQRKAKKFLVNTVREMKLQAIQNGILKKLSHSAGGKLSAKQEQAKNRITKELFTLASLASSEEFSLADLAEAAATTPKKQYIKSPLGGSKAKVSMRRNTPQKVRFNDEQVSNSSSALTSPPRLMMMSPARNLRATQTEVNIGLKRQTSMENARQSLPEIQPPLSSMQSLTSFDRRPRISSSLHNLNRYSTTPSTGTATASHSSTASNNITLSLKQQSSSSSLKSHSASSASSSHNRFGTVSRSSMARHTIIQLSSLNEIIEKKPLQMTRKHQNFDAKEASQASGSVPDVMQQRGGGCGGASGAIPDRNGLVEQQPQLSASFKKSSKRIVMKLQQDVERSVLNIPKVFQQKLWGGGQAQK